MVADTRFGIDGLV